MKMNKKGFFAGSEFIASFFIASIILVFAIGMYDFTIVELYEPVHDILNDSLAAQGITSGDAYDEFENNSENVHGYSLPFNIFYIFMFIYSIVFSLINVSNKKRIEPTELIFKSVGGMVFFIYILQIVVVKVLNYFQLEIVDYLFQDLIVSYIPFYSFTYNNIGLIALTWGVALIVTNWYLGDTKEKPTGVFGG